MYKQAFGLTIVFFLFLSLSQPLKAQTLISEAEAISLMDSLKANPIHPRSGHWMDQLFYWMDRTDSVYIFIGEASMNKLMNRKFEYAQQMYLLMLSGMARFDLDHKMEDMSRREVDKPYGYKCMCEGLENLLAQADKVKKAGYYLKLCRKMGFRVKK